MKGTFILILLTWWNTISAEDPYVFIPGQLILGGIFPIHLRDTTNYRAGCSKTLDYEHGIQAVEALKFSVNEINNNTSLLKNTTLGLWVFDSCNNPHHALVQSLNFFKGFAAQTESDFTCTYDKNQTHTTIAVIGAHSTAVTKEIAGMMSAFDVPLISYMATSPTLARKPLYPHFFRTVPNDKYIGEAILRILDKLKWNYASVVYSSSPYGIDGYQSLITAKANYTDICFGPSHIITDNFKKEDYEKIGKKLYSENHPPVVIVFAEMNTMKMFFETLNTTMNGRPPFTWILSDSVMYTTRKTANVLKRVNEIGKIIEGAILVYPESKLIPDFDDHFKGIINGTIKYERKEDPWHEEFMKNCVNCAENCANSNTKVTIESYQQNKYLNYVREAVYAVAYSAEKAIDSKCFGQSETICNHTMINGTDVLQHLRNITFKVSDTPFEFINGTDGPIRYTISIVQKTMNVSTDGTTNESYDLVHVGQYHGSHDGGFKLANTMMKYRLLNNGSWEEFPTLNCSCQPHCAYNQRSKSLEKDSSCKVCEDCKEFDKIEEGIRCVPCEEGQKPTPNRLNCEPIPEQSMNYLDAWSITAITIAVSGLIATIFASCVFMVYRDTPLIRASGRESSFLSLIGIMVSFFMTFIIYLSPNPVTCGVTRFGIGITYTICYSALVTKIIRIHRIFNNDKNVPRKLRYTSPSSQLIIIGILTLTEILILMIWVLVIPSTTVNIYPSRSINLKICSGLNNSSYLIGLAYPFILIVISTIYAIKIRKCPDGFNEAAYIGFTNYTTIILWLSFVPLYLGSIHYAKRVLTLAISLSFNGWVQLACLFGPKIYIVLFRPEKNTKELVLTTTKVNYPHRSAVVMLGNGESTLEDRVTD